jgi:V/A-type H+-transporting ATPase subunit F
LKKIAVITPPQSKYGFSLTGITQHAVEPHGLEETLKDIMADPDSGLVVIDERMLNGVTEERLHELEQGWHGILLILPSPVKPPAELEDYAARLIRRAIGYHVRLKL